MRVSVESHGTGWTVVDVPTCTMPKHVVWADDEEHAYCVFRRDLYVPGMCHIPSEVRKVRRVLILLESRTVLIDPIEDDEHESVADVIAAARNAPAEHQLSPVAPAPAYPVAAFVSLKRRDLHAPGLAARGFFL